MLKKVTKVLLYACLCGLISACSTTGAISPDVNKAGVVRKAYDNPASPSHPIVDAIINFSTAVLTVYTVGKIKNGPAVAKIISDHRLRKLEIENKVNSTVAVTRHDE